MLIYVNRMKKTFFVMIIVLTIIIFPQSAFTEQKSIEEDLYCLIKRLMTVQIVENIESENVMNNPSIETSIQGSSTYYTTTISNSVDFAGENTNIEGWITDPTGNTEGYLIEEYSTDLFELIGSRGQTSRHFFNRVTGKYRYQSDLLVQKAGVHQDSIWVTAEEYPHQFFIQLMTGENFFFDTAEEIELFLTTIDRATI